MDNPEYFSDYYSSSSTDEYSSEDDEYEMYCENCGEYYEICRCIE